MRVGRVLWSGTGSVATIAGIATIPSDLRDWGEIAVALGPEFFRWTLVIAGVLIVLIANGEAIRRRFFSDWLPMWDFRFERRDFYPFKKMVPLDKALPIIIRETEGSGLRKSAEMFGKTDPDKIRAFYARYVRDLEGAGIYGSKPPAGRVRRIPNSDGTPHRFAANAMALYEGDSEHPIFDRLCMMKTDIAKVIANLNHVNLP